jgi:hypothetical protein
MCEPQANSLFIASTTQARPAIRISTPSRILRNSSCVPNAAQVIASGKRDEFDGALRSISAGFLNPMKDSTISAIQRDCGGMVQDVMESRMDLVKYARSHAIGDNLGNVKVNEEYVWRILWDMMRGRHTSSLWRRQSKQSEL